MLVLNINEDIKEKEKRKDERKDERKRDRIKETKKGKFNYVRVELYTETPGEESNDRRAPAPHSQQNKIGVPPILELNNTSFGSRRTTTLVLSF